MTAYRCSMANGRTPATAPGTPPEQLLWGSSKLHWGHVLVVQSVRGVVAVRIGSDPGTMLAEVRAELPKADFREDPAALSDAIEVVRALAEGREGRELALDARGTEFQRAVWDVLRTIPRGEQWTYAKLAVEVGRPTAVRAVARACATNPTALVVPCHRVVRGDGSLGGYRWGLDVKADLLASERT